MRSLFRILFGFIVASLAAGVAQVLFVITPAEIAALPAAAIPERLQQAGLLALFAATHSAVFSAPFALVAVIVAESQGLRSPIYYVLAGLATAIAGFFAQRTGEPTGETIVNNYAAQAFLATGFAGGLAYWLAAGRRAGGRRADPGPTPRVRAS